MAELIGGALLGEVLSVIMLSTSRMILLMAMMLMTMMILMTMVILFMTMRLLITMIIATSY